MQIWLQAATAIRNTPLGGESQLTSDVVSFFGPSSQLWLLGLVFIRITSLIMVLPGLGDQMVPARVRISLGLLLAFVFLPMVRDQLPALPPSMGVALGYVLHELFAGLILGGLMRAFLFAMSIAGEVMSLQTTLSFAQTANPREAQSSTSIATFLAVLGLTLIYVTNTHHLFLRGLIDSYSLLPTVRPLHLGDSGQLMVEAITKSFSLAIQLSAPLIVFALVINVAAGFIGRLMPAFPIFFAATPLLVLAGLSLLAMGLGGIGLVFIEHYQEYLGTFIKGNIAGGVHG